MRARERWSKDCILSLILLLFSHFFLIPEGVFFLVSLFSSLSLSRASDVKTRDRPNLDEMRRWYKKVPFNIYEFNSWLHTSSWASSRARAGGNGSFFFLHLSFLLGNIFCHGRVLYAIAGVSRWSFFFGDDDLIIRNVFMISRRGMRVMWWLQNLFWAEERAFRRFCVKGRKKGRWREKRWMKANLRDDYKIVRVYIWAQILSK